MARTATDVQTEIDALIALISSGVKSASIDGQTTSFDLDSARKRLKELENELAVINDTALKRPTVLTVRLR